MRILVTGGAGLVGRAVVSLLVERGHDVLAIGRREGIVLDGAGYRACDILDFEALRKLVRGREAIVHLAAIPSPGMAPASELMQINVSGTFNVFQAAAEEGIERVVQASSINALGYYYGRVDFPIQYLPVDEEHPTYTTDPYSFSKGMVERIGDYFWRRQRISSVALRLPEVYRSERGRENIVERRERMSKLVDKLMAMSRAERSNWLYRASQRYNELRAQGLYETPGLWRKLRTDAQEDEREAFLAMSARHNFWAIIDDRDSALAVEKGLTAPYEGSHALFVQDRYNWAAIDAETLAGLFFPDVAARKRTMPGPASLVSGDKAAELIGFEPQYSFLPNE